MADPPVDNQAICLSQVKQVDITKEGGGVITGNLIISAENQPTPFFGCLNISDGKTFTISLGTITNQLNYEITSKGPQPVKLQTSEGFMVRQDDENICQLGTH